MSETAALLAGVIPEKRDVEKVHKLCKGLPGRMAVVRRLLDSGSTLAQILDAGPTEYLQFIELEVKAVDHLSAGQRLAVAAVAFAKHPIAKSTLLAVSELSEEELESVEQSCSFLKIPTEDSYAELQSETHRRWLEKRLRDLRDDVHNRYIDHLMKHPDTSDAIEFLPAYMLAVHRQQALVEAISREHYERLFGATRSLGALRARAQQGAAAAEELKLTRELFQFSLQRSIFSDLYFAEDFRGEVFALLALGQANAALDIASQAATSESRLAMLAAYARGSHELTGSVDAKVREHLRELADSIGKFDSHEVVEAISEDIACFDPELAIDLLEKPLTSEGGEFGKNLALARLGINSAVQRTHNSAKIVEQTSGKLTDEKLRSLVSFVAGITEGDLKSIIEFAAPMPPDKRIHFLRGVILTQKGRASHADLLDYALDQLIESSVYVPKIKDFSDLSAGLESSTEDLARLASTVQRIDAQLGLVDSSGATADYIRVQLNLAIAERRFRADWQADRVLDAYYTVYAIEQTEVRVECAALMLGYLHEIDRDGALEREHGLRDLLSSELRDGLTFLLGKTADHFEMVKGALGAISRFDAQAALDLARKLNTRRSRNSAMSLVAQTLVRFSSVDTAASVFEEITSGLSCDRERANCISSCVKVLSGAQDAVGWVKVLEESCINSIPSEVVARAAVDLALVQSRSSVGVSSELVGFIRKCAENCDAILRVEMLFAISRCLAPSDQEAAQVAFDEASAFKKSLIVSSRSSSGTVRACLSLLLRTFKALLKFDELTNEHLARFGRLCDVFDGPLVRLAFMSDLAVKAWCAGKLDKCRGIIEEHIQPTLDTLEGDALRRANTEVFPAIYLSRGAISFSMLDGLDVVARDEILYDLSYVVLRKVSAGDHWSGDESTLLVSRIDADSVCELLGEIHTDEYFCGVLSSFTEALNSRSTKQKLTKQIRADIGRRLRDLADAKLPDQANIAHDGYKVLAHAFCADLLDSKLPTWRALIEEARSIPCLSDSILVQLEIVDRMPDRFIAERKQLLNEVKGGIYELPSAYDRFWRINSFAQVAKGVDLAVSKNALQSAFKVTFELGDQKSSESCRRRVLDIAELIDSKFADSLVESMDDDAARAAAKVEAQQHTKIARAGRRLGGEKVSADSPELSSEVLPAAAWKHVGALVSGKSSPVHPNEFERHLKVASEWNLNDAYPVLSMYLENIGQRLMRASDIAAKVVPLAESILLSTELAVGLISKGAIREVVPVFRTLGDSSGMLVRRGERSEAFAYIRGWLRDLVQDQHIIICDPYFALEDLSVIRLISAEAQPSLISVVGSMNKMGGVLQGDLDAAWREQSDQDPCPTTIILVSDYADQTSPIHDRWILCSDSAKGLKLGTSFSGLGNKMADITLVSESMCEEIVGALKPFLNQVRLVGGARMKYSVLTL